MRAIGFWLALVVGVTTFTGPAGSEGGQPEEIYVVRSVRDSRVAPTGFCAADKVGFAAIAEDQYSLRSTALGSGGRITDADAQTVGDLHACFGSANPAAFYVEARMSGVAFKGLGECQPVKQNFPEQGIFSFRCWLDLSDLPAPYVGGLLTTNTVFSMSKPIGTETVPAGYTQASIATVRLWKKR